MLDLFSGVPTMMDLHLFCQSRHGKLGTESRPFLASCSSPISMLRCVGILVCALCLEPLIHHTPRIESVRSDALNETASCSHRDRVSCVPPRGISRKHQGFYRKTENVIRAHFSRRTQANNAACCFLLNRAERIVFRIACSTFHQSTLCGRAPFSISCFGNMANIGCGSPSLPQTLFHKRCNAVFVSCRELYQKGRALSTLGEA